MLGANPILDLFLYLSDGPKLSVTRVCADDFGTAVRHLRVLKVHASIFRLAARTAGLHLKPEKCVLVISVCDLDQPLLARIKDYLEKHVPDFAQFRIVPCGKYLGWWLGRDSMAVSMKAPLSKFLDRVREVVHGHGPIPSAVVRCNQRAISVLSYRYPVCSL